jgi:signal transduction histidine kinase
VRDTGPGISARASPLIFDRFYKIDTARNISRQRIGFRFQGTERHGGTTGND